MNRDTYLGLPDNVKKVIDEIWTAPSPPVDYYASYCREAALEGLELSKDLGVRIVLLSPETSKEWQKLINPPAVWEKGIVNAEEAGATTIRALVDEGVKYIEEYEVQNQPYKNNFELFADKYPGVVVIK